MKISVVLTLALILLKITGLLSISWWLALLPLVLVPLLFIGASIAGGILLMGGLMVMLGVEHARAMLRPRWGKR